MNSGKTEIISFNQDSSIATLIGKLLKIVNQFTYFDSSISSTESDVNKHIGRAQTAIDRLTTIWKSDLSDKIKREFFHAEDVSVLYGCTPGTKQLKKKFDGNYTKILRAVLIKS